MSSDLLSLLIPLNKKYINIVILYSGSRRFFLRMVGRKAKTVLDEIRRYKMCNFMTLLFVIILWV